MIACACRIDAEGLAQVPCFEFLGGLGLDPGLGVAGGGVCRGTAVLGLLMFGEPALPGRLPCIAVILGLQLQETT